METSHEDNHNNDHDDAANTAETSPEQKAQTEAADPVDNEKLMGILAYIGILFIVPLLAAKDSDFAMYHTNQGIVLFIAWVIVGAVNIIPILGQIVWFLGSIFLAVLMIMGIVNAAKMKKKPLPLIGGFKILS